MEWLMSDVHVYTDGSCLNTRTPGAARAGYSVYFGPGDHRNEAQPLSGEVQTNPRAELTAVLRALELAEPSFGRLVVHTGSRYAIDAAALVNRWRDNGWRGGGGSDIRNRDLVERIGEIVAERSGCAWSGPPTFCHETADPLGYCRANKTRARQAAAAADTAGLATSVAVPRKSRGAGGRLARTSAAAAACLPAGLLSP